MLTNSNYSLVCSVAHVTVSCGLLDAAFQVPRLKDTLQKLLTSVEPLYCDDPDGFATLKSEAADFECCMGPKLQQALVIKSWLSANYVSDWWSVGLSRLLDDAVLCGETGGLYVCYTR